MAVSGLDCLWSASASEEMLRSADDGCPKLQGVAENIADKIDRSLFERYGDVQGFGFNHAITRIVGDNGIIGTQNIAE